MSAPPVTAAPLPYLTRGVPALLVLGTFFVVTLPLVGVVLAKGQEAAVFLAYFVAINVTHFVLTFAVYLSRDNRRHFVSSPKNVLLFIVVPLLPLPFLLLWNGLALHAEWLAATAGINAVIRGLDFLHVNRQSFGMLQLFKMKAGAMPPWLKSVENGFFLSLALLLFAVLAGYALGWRAGAQRRQIALSGGYVAVQTAAALLATWRLELYASCLAVHVVEYHLIMHRRMLVSPAPHDVALSFFRRYPPVLYVALLIPAAAWFVMFRAQPAFASGPLSMRLMMHTLDGMFVVHYLLEMFIWKFKDPYLAKQLAPLFG